MDFLIVGIRFLAESGLDQLGHQARLSGFNVQHALPIVLEIVEPRGPHPPNLGASGVREDPRDIASLREAHAVKLAAVVDWHSQIYRSKNGAFFCEMSQ